MDKIKLGIIGLGQRGSGLLNEITQMDDIEIYAVCDSYKDRTEDAFKVIKEKCGNEPIMTQDYRDILKLPEIKAVLISAAWEAHADLAIASMRAGKWTALEVGGAYDISDCHKLVDAYEETKTPFMFLENCCYGRRELMCLNMAKSGVFGEIVHCDGAYMHDLREEVSSGAEIRHYRLQNYIHRNCENYPTHELGPIAKLLNINNGNRMLSLASFASKSAGLHDYVLGKRGSDDSLAAVDFKQGDVITTIIKCAGGETILLSLNTTLPHPYSRNFNVHGTHAYYAENNDSIFFNGDEGEGDWKPNWGNADKLSEQYDHPLWKEYLNDGVHSGHGGMDWLVLRAFFESVKENKLPPINVYDAAAWMSISALSEQSIALGGAPVPIPDFTRGKWIRGISYPQVEKYRLDVVPEIE